MRNIHQIDTERWQASLVRDCVRYSKTGTLEEVQLWLEEMKQTLKSLKPKAATTYAAIHAACDCGSEENVAKYRALSDEARAAAATARAQRDAAETKIRKLQAKLGIVKKKEWWEL